MARSVLVTGGAGFIGSHTADALLAAGHAVRILDSFEPQVHGAERLAPAYLQSACDIRRGDIRDPAVVREAVRGVDAIYHLAGMTSTPQSMYAMRQYMDVNVTGTAALWDAIGAEGGVERVILASSRAIYGEGAYDCEGCGRVAPEGRTEERLRQGDWTPRCPACASPILSVATDENQPARPQSIYGRTKLFQEDLSRQAGASLGVTTIALRYFNVYGPRQAIDNAYTGVANVFFGRRLEGQPIELFEDGLPVRDFVSVHDVVRANLRALTTSLSVPAINVGSGVPVTLQSLAQAVCRSLAVPSALKVTGWSRTGDIRSCFADTGLARDALDLHAMVPLEEGLCELRDWAHAVPRAEGTYRAMIDAIRAKGVLQASRPAGWPDGRDAVGLCALG